MPQENVSATPSANRKRTGGVHSFGKSQSSSTDNAKYKRKGGRTCTVGLCLAKSCTAWSELRSSDTSRSEANGAMGVGGSITYHKYGRVSGQMKRHERTLSAATGLDRAPTAMAQMKARQ
eukprot:1228299-Pleurochrysis_carterae.AAC.3